MTNPNDNPFQVLGQVPVHADRPRAKDPVCGMEVDPAAAKGAFEYEGTTYYFCNPRCLEKFKIAPAKYLAPGARVNMAAVMKLGLDEIEHTCPMHPEVRQKGPGACSSCGMALEPLEIASSEEESPELADMRRRFWISLLFTAPLVLLATATMAPGVRLSQLLPARSVTWLQLILAAPVVLWGGLPFFERGWASIIRRSPNMFTLISIGTGTAFAHSVVATLAPNIFPLSMRTSHGGRRFISTPQR